MFKVSSEPEFTRRVTVFVPSDGGHIPQTFSVTFRVLDDEQLGGTDGVEAQKDSLRKVIVKMDELIDDNDEAIPYSDGIRDQLLGLSYVRLALLKTYVSAVTKMKSGN